jgi:hypothetical protein
MKVFTTLALVVLATLSPVAAAPASAGTYCEVFRQCGDFEHINDDGYDAPIKVTCNLANPDSNVQYVAEYDKATCHDTDGFYVGSGKTVSCLFHGDGYAWVKYTSVGWHKINDGQNVQCVHGLA